jgi:porin
VKLLRRALAPLLLVGCLPAVAAAGDRATGDWGGARSRLSQAGVEIEVDYTAESFMRDDAENGSYLGNVDAFVILDTAKLGWWQGGRFFVYAQSSHSSGISRSLNLFMPVSNLDAEPFTQLSEFWLEQQVGERLTLRLGKQDANGDFAGPRFSGNFVNSSFGVLPGSPIPSFPAPALGAAVLAQPTSWLEIDAGVYEGNPEVESFGESAFEDDSGVFAIGALVLRHEAGRPDAGALSVGGWTHTEPDRSGMYGVYDLLVHVNPNDPDDPRSFQAFVRANWTTDEDDGEIGFYTGGGVTAHGFLGRNNTIGVGFGYVETDAEHEAFVELFYKWRPVPWLTVEPDVQLYDTGRGNPVFAGLRLKLKL